MTEEQYRIQDWRLKRIGTLIAAIGGVGVIASIWFGFSQLVSQSKVQTATIQDQWSRKFYDERLTAYSRATEAAARIAALKSAGAPEIQTGDAKLQFKTLFWGPMCITESEDVEAAMVLFQTAVDAGASAEQLEQLSLRLAWICGNETHASYPTRERFPDHKSKPKILEEMRGYVPETSQKQP
jgi:hypothetical protein